MRGDPAWERDFNKAQSVRTVIINSLQYDRIAYGDEENDWDAGRGCCHDCGVK
jgi:hypothetical protein